MQLSSQRHDKCLELKSDNWDGEKMTDLRDILEVNRQDSGTDWIGCEGGIKNDFLVYRLDDGCWCPSVPRFKGSYLILPYITLNIPYLLLKTVGF